MTLVFSAGIFVIMFPIVLGFKFLSNLFMDFHNQTFILGGLLMVFIGVFALLGIKLPMPNFKQPESDPNNPDVLSIFTLGVFSGITSSCCAPVLLGVLTLSFLSPSVWFGGLVAIVYVLGMVTPLYLLAYFVDAKKILNAQFFKKKITEVKMLGKTYPIVMSNVLAFLVFAPMGILTIVLTLTGKLEMAEEAEKFGEWVGQLTITINELVGDSWITQGLFLLLLVSLFLFLYTSWRNKQK